jgi:hypothetical protein
LRSATTTRTRCCPDVTSFVVADLALKGFRSGPVADMGGSG